MNVVSVAAERRKLIAKVHVAKKQLGYDDELYRDVMVRVTGAASAADLSIEQLGALVREFQRLGWAPRSAKGKRPSENGQVRLIWGIWSEMARGGLLRDASRASLRSFVQNRTGVSDPEWLTAKQTRQVIEALKSWHRSLRRRAGGAL